MTPRKKQYTSYVTLLRWTDGDTALVDNDLGHRVAMRRIGLRLAGIDTPELTSPDSLEVAAAGKVLRFLMGMWPVGTEFMFHSSASVDKYGRLLGRICDLTSYNYVDDILLAAGFARAYSGGTKAPWGEEELRRILYTDTTRGLGNGGSCAGGDETTTR